MSDPFTTLRTPIVPTSPDPGFTARLRTRIVEALGLPEGVDVTVTTLEDLAHFTASPEPADEPAAAPAPAPRMTLTPYLAVADARRALDWYADAFGARLRGEPILMPDGRVGHAELEFGGALVMLADEFPDIGHTAPRPGAGSPVTIHLETADIDVLVERAVDGGADLARAPEDSPYGRNATLVDPFGHRWILSAPARTDPNPDDSESTRTEATRYPHGTRHGDVGYVSFQVPDVDRAQAFYGTVLNWTFAPGEGPQSRMVVDSMPLTSLWGGEGSGPVICWRVDDIFDAVGKVRALGGTATDPVERPYGLSADCTDDQGMAFYLWQPTPDDARATADVDDRPENGRREGDLAYLTLRVVDSARFRAFFGQLLGWEFSPGRVADGWSVEGPMPMVGFTGGAAQPGAVPMYRVDDVEAAAGRVRTAGGTATAVERMPYGLTSECQDDQGIPFYLGQL
jgi:predicted enzyme related to lactoylglutathione lyase